MSKNLPIMTNINNSTIEPCSFEPLTGFYRDGYCRTGSDDIGTHTVCAKMSKKFLEYTKSKGNNLYSVVKPGQNWCLCEYRWNEAYKDGFAPYVNTNATNKRTDKEITQNIFKHSKLFGGEEKKQFLYNPNDPKKSFDVYIDKNPDDTISIKYKTVSNVKNTIKKLEKLYKSKQYTHKRIWQVAMIMKVRLEVILKRFPNAKNINQRFKLALKYYNFLKLRTQKPIRSKLRYNMKFKF